VGTVLWQGETVYQGRVEGEIEWSIPSTTWGYADFTMTLQGHGSMIWQDLHMNYTGCIRCLPGSEGDTKILRVEPKNFFSAPCVGSDCRSQVQIDQHQITIDRGPNETGAWHYELQAPCKVTAKIRIDRQKTMLWTPDA
jgi:hypothetical protein